MGGGRASGHDAARAGPRDAWRPDIGRLLPVYVADRYEGFEARTLLECSDAEIEAYVQANVDAVRDVCARARPDVALANHLVMGPAIVARGLEGAVPYAVKVHGSALEYVVKRDPSASCRGRGRAWRGARRSSSARATRASRCGRRCRTRRCPGAPGSGPPGSTSPSSARATTRPRGSRP